MNPTNAAPLIVAAMTCTITASFPDGSTTNFAIAADANRSVGGVYTTFEVLPAGGPAQNALKLTFTLDLSLPPTERLTFPSFNAVTNADPTTIDLNPLVSGLVPVVNDSTGDDTLTIYVPLGSTQAMGNPDVVIDVHVLVYALSGHEGLLAAWRRT